MVCVGTEFHTCACRLDKVHGQGGAASGAAALRRLGLGLSLKGELSRSRLAVLYLDVMTAFPLSFGAA